METVDEQSEPQTAASEPAPARARRISVPLGAEIAVYVLAVVLITWPGILHARTQIFGAGDDARYYTWLGWRMGRLIEHGHLIPTHVPDVIVPFGLDLRLLDGYLPSYVSGLFNLIVGPILAFNLAFIVGAILNIVAARALVRRLSPHRLVIAVATIAFLTAPPVALNVQLGLLPLFWAFTVPLLVADALDVLRGDRAVRPIRLTCLLVLAYLCSIYFLVFGGMAYGLIVAVAAIRRRSWRMPLMMGAAVGCTIILLLPFIVPRLSFDHSESARGADPALLSDSRIFSADLLSVIAQPTRSTFLFPRPHAVSESLQRLPDPTFALEETMFPGLILLVGFALFLFRRGKDLRRLPLALVAAVMWVLSLGPSLKVGGNFVWKRNGKGVSWLPFRVLLAIPALGALRVPIRTGPTFVTVLVAGTAIALHRLVSRHPERSIWYALGATLLLATNLLLPVSTTTLGTTAPSERAIRAIAREAHPGDSVLRVPSDCDNSFASYQMLHHTPVVGCTGSFAANPWSKLVTYTQSAAFDKLRCDREHYGRISTRDPGEETFGPADVAELRQEFGVRFLIVDHALLGVCPAVAATLPFLLTYRSLGGDDRFSVVDLASPASG